MSTQYPYYTSEIIAAQQARDIQERSGPLVQFSHHEHVSKEDSGDDRAKTIFYYRHVPSGELCHMVSVKYVKDGGLIRQETPFSSFKGA